MSRTPDLATALLIYVKRLAYIYLKIWRTAEYAVIFFSGRWAYQASTSASPAAAIRSARWRGSPGLGPVAAATTTAAEDAAGSHAVAEAAGPAAGPAAAQTGYDHFWLSFGFSFGRTNILATASLGSSSQNDN